MKCIRRGAVTTILYLATAQAVFAGSIGDSFTSWLLGSEAQASTLTDRPLRLQTTNLSWIVSHRVVFNATTVRVPAISRSKTRMLRCGFQVLVCR